MYKHHHHACRSAIILAALGLSPIPALAADSADLQQIRQEIDTLRQGYEKRINELETRLQNAEATANKAEQAAQNAPANSAPSTPAAGGNAFNPEIGMVLSGSYSNFKRNPDGYRITGFAPGGDIGPGSRGFSLGESEVNFSANVDQLFYGNLTLSVGADDKIHAEEAFIQTTAMPAGFRLKAGRFFSGIGYINGQHAHAWDFADSPLVYQAFLGGQYAQEGIQASWVAPTRMFVELGSEMGRGKEFPGADSQRNKPGSQAVFAHVGDDIGVSQSWRAGLSWLRHTPQNRSQTDTNLANTNVTDSFTGTSNIVGADFVWKWAPNGNGERQNLKLQGEFYRRMEKGQLVYDTANANTQGDYRTAQSGWYVQSVYQFIPNWRVGARYERLNSGTVDYGSNALVLGDERFRPSKTSLMVDWNPSEFSRIRLQVAQDKSRRDLKDQQVTLQYQMSLGAHGAHSY